MLSLNTWLPPQKSYQSSTYLGLSMTLGPFVGVDLNL